MKVSYNLLQRYFTKKLPPAEKLADLLTFHAFEIEGMEVKNGDTVLDVKVLPDRAHYALSHRGVAREISFILDERMDGRVPMEIRGGGKDGAFEFDVNSIKTMSTDAINALIGQIFASLSGPRSTPR